MYARVTQVQIHPDKIREYKRAADSLRPLMRKQAGFCALIILRTGDASAPEATTVALWDSLEDLKASEKNLWLYQAISRILSYCKGFPAIREHEVLFTEFALDATAAKKKDVETDETQW